MRHLTLGEVLALHQRIISESGGRSGMRDLGVVASAVHQPSVTVGGKDAYPSLVDKVAALGFSLAGNHGFVDGNKHIAHAAMETMLVLNGHEITATVDEQEATMLTLAAGKLTREALASWLHAHSAPIDVSNT